jgi:hypothetical protein
VPVLGCDPVPQNPERPPSRAAAGSLAVNRRLLLGGVLAVSFAWSWPRGAQSSPVRVTREEPIVRRYQFDPRRPLPGMPKLTPPESGVCNTTFELAASVSYSAELLSATTARVQVDELDLTTRLSFDIYTIENAPPKLIAHEEGHRKIGEHFYRDAPRIAEEIGRRLIGATFEGAGVDGDAAQRDGFEKVVASIEQAYMARVRIPSAAANVRYDEITNHGLHDIGEDEGDLARVK